MSVIPRHSILAGSLPNLGLLKVGEIAINIPDRSFWCSDGTALVKVNGANQLHELDNMDSTTMSPINLLANNSLLQWRTSNQKWRATTEVKLGAGSTGHLSGISIGASTTSALNSVSVGLGASSAQEGVSIGPNTIGGSKSYLIGSGINAPTVGESILIGESISATGAKSVAIGSTSVAIDGSVAIGFGAVPNSSLATCIGYSSAGSGVAVGRSASTSVSSGAALGNSAVSTAAGAVQLGVGTNPDANTLQFLNVKIANNRSLQVLYAPNLSTLTSMSPMPPNGTLAINAANGTLQMVHNGLWITAASAAFDPSTVTLGTLANVKSSSTDTLTAGQDGHLLNWSNADGEWASTGVVDGTKLIIKPKAYGTSGQAPTLANVTLGEISINRHTGSPCLFIRAGTGASDSPSDKIIRIGPAVVSTTAPIAASTGETPGALWFKSDTQQLRVYSGSSWVTTKAKLAHVGTAPPTGAEDGDLWFDTNTAVLKVYLGQFTVWVEINSGAVVAVYFGNTSPNHSTSSVTITGFPQAAANGSYVGVANFNDLQGITGTSQTLPAPGYGNPTAGVVVWTKDTIYRKLGTGWYLWKQNGYWYLVDASRLPTAGAWYRSQGTITGGPETVATWVSITTNETNPVATGTVVPSITVQRITGIVPQTGELWYDSGVGALNTWDGTDWLKMGCTAAEFAALTARVAALEAA